jgi:hypothetical protein
MPGASLQTAGASFTGILSDTMVDYAFGHPDLENNFSNIAPELNLAPNPPGSPYVVGEYLNNSQTGPDSSDITIDYVFGNTVGVASTGISLNATGTIATIDNNITNNLIDINCNFYITPKNTLNNMFLGPQMSCKINFNDQMINEQTGAFAFQTLPLGGSGPVCNLIPVVNKVDVKSGDKISITVSQLPGPTGYSGGFYIFYPGSTSPNNTITPNYLFSPYENSNVYYTNNLINEQYVTIQNYLQLTNNPTGPNL